MDAIELFYDDDVPQYHAALEEKLTRHTRTILEALGAQGRFITILICTPTTIQELNHRFRKKNSVTDILSWVYEAEEDGVPIELSPWGELAICKDICIKQAKQANLTEEEEVLRLLVHGLTHLAGFDHETEEEEEIMLKKEIELLALIGLDKLY